MRGAYLSKLCSYAWGRTMHDVIGQTQGQRVARSLVAACAVVLPYVYVRWINHSSQAFSDALRAWLWATATIMTAASLAFAYYLLFEGPYQLWMEEKRRADAAHGANPNAAETTDRRKFIQNEVRKHFKLISDAIAAVQGAETDENYIAARDSQLIAAVNGAAKWIKENMGSAALERFRTPPPPPGPYWGTESWPGEHDPALKNNRSKWIRGSRERLGVLDTFLRSDAYDGEPAK